MLIHAQVYDILQCIQYGEDADQIGIGQLLTNHSFNSAFPLHDVSHALSLYVYSMCSSRAHIFVQVEKKLTMKDKLVKNIISKF